MKNYYLLLSLAVVLGFSACKKDDDDSIDYDTTENYYRNVSVIEVEVAYEPDAEPFTTLTNGDNIWKFTETNIEALFAGRAIDVDVTVPPNLAAMNPIPDQGRDNFSAQNILNLATKYREGNNSENLGNLWVVFLDGYFKDSDDSLRTNVLGVNITGTSITAIFKPVITSSGGLAALHRYTEQSTVVHELGHALGLVNSGVPETTSHEDPDYKAHCSNVDCVMYWQQQASSDAGNFLGLTGNSDFKVVFGAECLQDTRLFNP